MITNIKSRFKGSNFFVTMFVILLVTGIVVNYLYHTFRTDFKNVNFDIVYFFVEQLILLTFSGAGFMLVFKIWLIKNHRNLISESLYFLDDVELNNHSVFSMLDSIFDNIYSLGKISDKEGRFILFTEICKLEQFHLKFFFSTLIHDITNYADRNDSNYLVNLVRDKFREYNEELIELMKYEAFPTLVISSYLEFKKDFIETVLIYLNSLQDTNNKKIGYVTSCRVIDSITVLNLLMLKKLQKDINKMNGDLNGQLFRGHIL
jgi:hypothetical protein